MVRKICLLRNTSTLCVLLLNHLNKLINIQGFLKILK